MVKLKPFRFSNQCSLLWALIIFIVFTSKQYAQSHKLFIEGEDNLPLQNVKIVINKNINLFTNKNGEVNFEGVLSEIEINQDNYYFKESDILKDGLYKIHLIKSTILEEVIISTKDSILNEYEPKKDKRDYNCSFLNENLAILTSFEISKKSKIINYSFFITSREKYNIPFNFVIYLKNNSKLTKIFSEKIDKYSINDNTFDLSSKKIILESGEYLFGMEWIFLEPKQKYYRKVFDILEIYGQSLGGSLLKKSISKNNFYKNNFLQKIENQIFQQIKIKI